MLNLRQIGCQRVNDIKSSLETYQALTIEQLVQLHFKDMKSGVVKARERLNKLVNCYKSINKDRLDASGKLYYYFNKMPNHNSIQHVINRNWGFIYLLNNKKDYQKVVDLDLEYNLDILVADGFMGLYNTFTKDTDYWFIESDKTNSKNKFEKILKYTEYYKSGKYKLEHWASKTKKFPGVLIITDSSSKAIRILELIEKQNTEDIRFVVMTVEEIKSMLMNRL